MNKIKEISIVTAIGTLAVLITLWVVGFVGVKPPLGGAKASTAAVAATSTVYQIAIGVVTPVIATTTTCTSRIVSTGVGAVELSFSDIQGNYLLNQMGHVQAASSTVVYDASLYGCGLMRAKPELGTALRVTETY